MATLVEDLRQVIERDQWVARPLLHDHGRAAAQIGRGARAARAILPAQPGGGARAGALPHRPRARPQEHRHPSPDGPVRDGARRLRDGADDLSRRQCDAGQRTFAVDGGAAAAPARPRRRGDQALFRPARPAEARPSGTSARAARPGDDAARRRPAARLRPHHERTGVALPARSRCASPACSPSATIPSTIPAGRNSPASPSWRWRCAAPPTSRGRRAIPPTFLMPEDREALLAYAAQNPARCSSPSRGAAPAARTWRSRATPPALADKRRRRRAALRRAALSRRRPQGPCAAARARRLARPVPRLSPRRGRRAFRARRPTT